MPDELTPSIPAAKRKKKSKKKKKKKDKNKSQKNESNGKSYSQYHGDAPKGNRDGHNIVQYGTDQGENNGSLFSFCEPQADPSASSAWSKDGRKGTFVTGIPGMNSPDINGRRLGINTGQLNSAEGEGTTIPQLLDKIRFFTIIFSGTTIVIEVWSMIVKIIFLQASKIVLGIYLLFFVGLLLLFEAVRGTPIPTASISSNVDGLYGNLNFNATQMAEIVWKTALEQRWARQVRYFLQDNFGILYSCVGRGFYLCFIGSVAIGQGFPQSINGFCFMLMGLWTLTLRCRFPSLEKAMIMDLESEFGEERERLHSRFLGSKNGITWSSVRSAGSSVGSDERQGLLR